MKFPFKLFEAINLHVFAWKLFLQNDFEHFFQYISTPHSSPPTHSISPPFFLFLGLDIEATTKSFMSVVGFEAMIPVVMLLVYLGVEWYLMDAVAVVESAKGMRRVLFLMITLLVILHGIISGWFMLAIQKENNQRIYVEA